MAAKYHDGNLPLAIETVLRQIASLEEDLEFWMDDAAGVKLLRAGQIVNTEKIRRRVVSILNQSDATSVAAIRPPDEPPPASRFTDQELAEMMCIRKRAYSSPEAAGRGAAKAHANGSQDRLRVYRCPFGDHFHLTKREVWTPPGER